MGKPVGLGPRLVAIQQAGISKEEAGKQIQAQTVQGVPPREMVLTNPETGKTVPANIPAPSEAAPIDAPREQGIVLRPGESLFAAWGRIALENIMKKIKAALGLGQSYKTNQWDGTISELERER